MKPGCASPDRCAVTALELEAHVGESAATLHAFSKHCLCDIFTPLLTGSRRIIGIIMDQRHLRMETLSRAQGCLLGQLAEDSLGSLVEFRAPDDIRREYAKGVRKLADGGTWNTITGQPKDDSEMALLLARMPADQGWYDPEEARKTNIFWLGSRPFDCGMTVAAGLRGRPNPDSQDNGAMMRITARWVFSETNMTGSRLPSGHDRRRRSPIPTRSVSRLTPCSRWPLPMLSAKGVTPETRIGKS